MPEAPIVPFDWHRIWWADDISWPFLLEVGFRCGFTYLLILGALRIMGRRGVRQLSIFELSIILGLGSAAGDAMLYNDTPLLPATVVFMVVTALYVLFNRLTEWFPTLLRLAGRPARAAGGRRCDSSAELPLPEADPQGAVRGVAAATGGAPGPGAPGLH